MSQTFFVKREITYLINFSMLLFPYSGSLHIFHLCNKTWKISVTDFNVNNFSTCFFTLSLDSLLLLVFLIPQRNSLTCGNKEIREDSASLYWKKNFVTEWMHKTISLEFFIVSAKVALDLGVELCRHTSRHRIIKFWKVSCVTNRIDFPKVRLVL